VTDHAASECETNSSVLQIHPDADPDSNSKKRIKLGSSKGNSLKEVSWENDHTHIPTDSQIMELADRQENNFFNGFSALHWACELHRDSLVQVIIDRKLVHPDIVATNSNFSSFTPVFSAISSLWLIEKLSSERGEKELRDHEGERLCLNVIRMLAAAGATLNSDVTVSIPGLGHNGMHVTLLLIAADYACLYHGGAFKRRQTFLLEVARILADNLLPTERAMLFWRRCKVDGHNAVSVC
jgi:hypothetical protein